MKDREDRQTLDVISGGLKLGYARVSTDDQELLLQHDALKEAGCAEIYDDKISGKKKERPGLDNVMKALRPGDSLVVWRLDRLGRSLQHLVEIINDLEARNVRLEILVEAIDTRTASGRMIAGIFGALAEYQANLIRENTIAGLRAAARQGRKGGRKTIMTPAKKKQARTLLLSGESASDVAKALNVGRTTLYRNVPVGAIHEERIKLIAEGLLNEHK
ncbi:recombinase family protein [Halomonas sp. 3A7M]|nr:MULTISPECIES: recombinase family protein [unclassified Halomonas]